MWFQDIDVDPLLSEVSRRVKADVLVLACYEGS